MNKLTNEQIAALRAEIAAEWKKTEREGRLMTAGVLLFLISFGWLVVHSL